MTKQRIQAYRDRLLQLEARLRGDQATMEDEVRTGTGGPSGGNLSNAPMHQGDLGTSEYTQELDATLYENEEHLRAEVRDAIDRVEQGTFGSCERCGREIAGARLDALPYTRYCTSCAEKVQAGEPVNLDEGRPQSGLDPTARRAGEAVPEGVIPGDDENALAAEESDTTASAHQEDTHATGTPAGGTAVGGLAGTNTGEGDPANADLEDAMGSGQYDQRIEGGRGETADQPKREGRKAPR